MEKVERTIRYNVNRRRFLRDSTLATLGIIAAACAPGTGTTGTSGGGTALRVRSSTGRPRLRKGSLQLFATGSSCTAGSPDIFIPALGMGRAEGKWITSGEYRRSTATSSEVSCVDLKGRRRRGTAKMS